MNSTEHTWCSSTSFHTTSPKVNQMNQTINDPSLITFIMAWQILKARFCSFFFICGWQLDNCFFGHVRMGHTCNDLFSPSPHPLTPLSNLVVIHFYFPGLTRLRISFELIIAFLDVNQVLLLFLKYHRHLNNLKRLHLVSKLIRFQSG